MKCILCGTTHFSRVHGPRLDSRRRIVDARRVGKCTNCGLVQVVPMPSKKEIRKLYHEDMEHFEPYIEQIDVHRQYFRQKIQEIKKVFLPSTIYHLRSSLLDIGCAMGVLLEEAKKVGYRAQGIDISHDAVLYCREKKLNVMEGTLESLSKKLKYNSFTAITAFEIIEHERDPLAMMRWVHTLLKKGGVAVLTTPNHDSFWRKMMGKWWVGYHHPEHVTFWDPQSLRELFERAGFRHITIRRDSPRPFPLSFAVARGADYFPWASWFLKPFGKFLDRFNLKNPINPWDDLIVIGKK